MMRDYLPDITTLVIAFIAFVFGYGSLASRVDVIESNQREEKIYYRAIDQNITIIKEDISYLRGVLEKQKQRGE